MVSKGVRVASRALESEERLTASAGGGASEASDRDSTKGAVWAVTWAGLCRRAFGAHHAPSRVESL